MNLDQNSSFDQQLIYYSVIVQYIPIFQIGVTREWQSKWVFLITHLQCMERNEAQIAWKAPQKAYNHLWIIQSDSSINIFIDCSQ